MLNIGTKAPLFQGKDQNGNPIALKNFIGKKIVLYFYPKDNTPGCTAQACNLRDNIATLLDKGFQVIGISTDSVKSHKNFEEKFALPFPLVADETKEIVKQYEVFGEKKFMGKTYLGTNRTTFIIDEKGIITHILKKPDTKNHTQEILNLFS